MKCKAKGCFYTVKEGHGMCKKHWFMVPASLRTQIWDTVGTAINRDLWNEAVDAVAAKEANPEPKAEGSQ